MSEAVRNIDRQDAGTVVRLGGEIDMHVSPELHRSLAELCAEKPKRLVLDLSAVEYLDSSGIGSLVEIYRRIMKDDGRLILLSPSERVTGVLEITKLDQFFTIVGTEQEALSA